MDENGLFLDDDLFFVEDVTSEDGEDDTDV